MSTSATVVGRMLFTVIGTSVAGPVGGVVGNLAGGLLQAILPGPTDIVSNVLGNVTTEALKKTGTAVVGRLAPQEKQRINHDLQTAFRDAFQEALYDVGGAACFPQAWRPQRDVPPTGSYPSTPQGHRLWREHSPLAEQVRQCFQDMQRALKEERLLPLDPAIDQPATSVAVYLEADTPQALVDAFYDQALAPFLAGYETLLAELPDFGRHLRAHLLDRTLVHLGEALKERPRAWRAFNRLMLDGMRCELQALGAGQAEITQQLDKLLTRPDAEGMASWADGMADLLTATGQIEKRLDEGFDTLTRRVVEQHHEVATRLDGLLVVTVRIETKVDRVLRILEDGRYEIVGKPAMPTDLPPEPGDPPYKGLQHFDQIDAALFFGRELLTARLAGHLRQHNFLAVVVGASGSGKSSVVRAGLLPAVRRGEPLADGTLPPAGSAAWPVHIITPTAHPLESLAASLTRDCESVTAATSLAADLKSDPRSLGLYVRRLLASRGATGSGRLLLVVDQFEELFTLCDDPAERRAFIDNLLSAVGCELGSEQGTEALPSAAVALRGDSPTTVVITLRADFYYHCGQYASLRNALEQCQAYIGPMDQDELRRAIEEPARLGGWRFERGLVDLMLRDVGDEPGALPLLSHALLETWKRRRGRVMTLESYAESGGVRGAISKTADAVYLGLAPDAQAIARSIFLRLTELGEGTQDTRRRVELAELIPSSEQATAVHAVLKTLTDARLVTTDQDGTAGVETVEVAHEALIRAWPRLRGWLAEDRAGLRVHRCLTEAALAWQRLGREPGSLYRGARLVEVGDYAMAHADALNTLEREFLATSQSALAAEAAGREAQRRRELAAAHALAEEQTHRAEAQRLRAEAEAQRAAAETQRAAEHARMAVQLRRRAVLLTGVLLMTVVFCIAAVSAAGFALRQTVKAVAAQGEAESERSRAETQAHLAFGRELAAASLANLTVDPERSILLALHAISETRAVTETMLPEVEDALQRSVQTSRVLLRLPNQRGMVLNVAFSPDGTRLVTASETAARIWDAGRGELLVALSGHTDWVIAAVFSSNGQKVATASGDNTAIVWDTATGKTLSRLEHPVAVRAVLFMPDGRRLITAGGDNLVRVWDLSTGQLQRTFEHTGEVRDIALDHAGRQLAAGNDHGDVQIWDAEDGTGLMEWSVGSLPINAVEFTPDDERLVTASGHKAQVWQLPASAHAEPLLTMDDDSTIFAVAIHPSGAYLATGRADGKAVLWDLVSEERANRQLITWYGHANAIQSIAFSPDGASLATACSDGTVHVWDASIALTRAVSSIGFAPDGRLIELISPEGRMVLWDPTTATEEPLLDGLGQNIAHLDYSADGSRAIVVDSDTQLLTVWNMASTKPQATLSLEGSARDTKLSRDGKRVAVIDQADANRVAVWDATTGERLFTLSGHTNWIDEVSFSLDGKLLATGAEDHTARIWDAQDGKELYVLSQGGTAAVNAVAFSPDCARLATAGDDGSIIIWDVKTGESLQRFIAHTHAIYDVAFSLDGRLLATASEDTRVRLWDASSPDFPLLRTYTEPNAVTGIEFSPDGSRLLIAVFGDDSPFALYIYWLDPDTLLAQARSRVTRSLLGEECNEYLHTASCPTLPGLPPPPAVLTDPLPYTADFSASGCGGWDQYSDQDTQHRCQDGTYHIIVATANLQTYEWAGKYFTNMDLEVDATQVSGPDNNEYGVILRRVDSDNRYQFMISGDRYYTFEKRENGSLTSLIKWTSSDAIRGGNATNHLRVKAVGGHFTFYVNGQELATFDDSTFEGGDVGLIAGTFADQVNVHASFSNLTVRPVES